MPASTQTALHWAPLKSSVLLDEIEFLSSPISFIECQEPGELFIVDIRVNVHLPCVDLHNTRSGLLGRGGELDLSIKPGQRVDSEGVRFEVKSWNCRRKYSLWVPSMNNKVVWNKSDCFTCQNAEVQDPEYRLCL